LENVSLPTKVIRKIDIIPIKYLKLRKKYLCENNAVICVWVFLSDFERTFLAKKVAYYNSRLYICNIKQVLNRLYIAN